MSAAEARDPAPELVRLAPEQIEEIARRLLELLSPVAAPAPEPVIDAAEVARRYGLDRAWVYAHADELGAIRLGDGSRPRLRFDPETVVDKLTARFGSERSEGRSKPISTRKRTPRERPDSGSGVPLLPIRGRKT